MEPKYKAGDKVVPVNKSVGSRSFDGCATFYRMVELKQDFLYIRGLDDELTREHGFPVYWCEIVPGDGHAGDLYAETDLAIMPVVEVTAQ